MLGKEKMTNETEDKAPDTPKKLTFMQIVLSVLGAALGVQTDKTRQRDFNKGSPLVYIAAGILFTLVFILTVVLVVNLVLSGR